MNGIISKGASNSRTARTPAFFYESARAGMLDLLVEGPSPKAGRDGVLLPAYIGWSANEGSGVFDPVRESGRPHGFYGLGADLSVDLEDLKRQLTRGRYQYLVVIHYFGRLERRMSMIRELADNAGVTVVDDLAHGFFSAMRAPEQRAKAEVAMYSLHKQFPMRHGGMVVYRDTNLLRNQLSVEPSLAGELLSYDWNEIADRRRTNFKRTLEALSPHLDDLQVQLMWPELHFHDVPQSLPVLLESTDRNRVYSELNEKGYGMVSLYHTLIEEMRGRDVTIDRIAGQIINFPVHQDVDPNSIDSLIDAFKTAVQRHKKGKS